MFPDYSRTLRESKIKKVTINLGTARSDASLVEEGLLPNCVMTSLTVLDKGAGTFSFKFRFKDGSVSESFENTEVLNGDIFALEFIDVVFTNAQQSNNSVKFIVAWVI